MSFPHCSFFLFGKVYHNVLYLFLLILHFLYFLLYIRFFLSFFIRCSYIHIYSPLFLLLLHISYTHFIFSFSLFSFFRFHFFYSLVLSSFCVHTFCSFHLLSSPLPLLPLRCPRWIYTPPHFLRPPHSPFTFPFFFSTSSFRVYIFLLLHLFFLLCAFSFPPAPPYTLLCSLFTPSP